MSWRGLVMAVVPTVFFKSSARYPVQHHFNCKPNTPTLMATVTRSTRIRPLAKVLQVGAASQVALARRGGANAVGPELVAWTRQWEVEA